MTRNDWHLMQLPLSSEESRPCCSLNFAVYGHVLLLLFVVVVIGVRSNQTTTQLYKT